MNTFQNDNLIFYKVQTGEAFIAQLPDQKTSNYANECTAKRLVSRRGQFILK